MLGGVQGPAGIARASGNSLLARRILGLSYYGRILPVPCLQRQRQSRSHHSSAGLRWDTLSVPNKSSPIDFGYSRSHRDPLVLVSCVTPGGRIPEPGRGFPTCVHNSPRNPELRLRHVGLGWTEKSLVLPRTAARQASDLPARTAACLLSGTLALELMALRHPEATGYPRAQARNKRIW